MRGPRRGAGTSERAPVEKGLRHAGQGLVWPGLLGRRQSLSFLPVLSLAAPALVDVRRFALGGGAAGPLRSRFARSRWPLVVAVTERVECRFRR